MRRISSFLVMSALLLTAVNGWAVETVTYHGTDGSRQGYFPVNDQASPITNTEVQGSITTDTLMTPSPVTALIKKKTETHEWWHKEQIGNCYQRIAVCAENVLSVYGIGYEYDDELDLKWTYTFNSSVVSTPVTFTLYPCTEDFESVEALFVITHGFYNFGGGFGEYTESQIHYPEIFIFDIKTGEILLWKELQYIEQNYMMHVYSSPSYYETDTIFDEDDDIDEIHFYFTAIAAVEIYDPPIMMDFIRADIKLDAQGEWTWPANPFTVWTDFSEGYDTDTGRISYCSPAIIYDHEYKYDDGTETYPLKTWIVQPHIDGTLYLIPWNFWHGFKHEWCESVYIEDDDENKAGKYLHSSPSIYVSDSNSMIEESTGNDQGFIVYIDIGLDYFIQDPQNPDPKALFVRFTLYRPIWIEDDEYLVGFEFEEINHVQLAYEFVTSSSMLTCLYDDGLDVWLSSWDQHLYREYVISWDCYWDVSDYTTEMSLTILEAEQEFDSADVDEMLLNSHIAIHWVLIGFTSFHTDYQVPIIPSPVCVDNYIFVVFGNIQYRVEILRNGDAYTALYGNVIATVTLESICFSTPALSHRIKQHWDAGTKCYQQFQLMVLTVKGQLYYISADKDMFTDDSKDCYKPRPWDDKQWHGFHNGTSSSPPPPQRRHSLIGHMNMEWAWSVWGGWITLTPKKTDVWNTDDIDTPLSSPICFNENDEHYVVSAQKSTVVCFDEDLNVRWKVYVATPIYATPTIIKDLHRKIGVFDQGTVDVVVIITKGYYYRKNPPLNDWTNNDGARVYLFRLDDGQLIDEYPLRNAFPNHNPHWDELSVYSSPLYHHAVIPPNEFDYLFFTATEVDHNYYPFATHWLFRFKVVPVWIVNVIGVELIFQEKLDYFSGAVWDPWGEKQWEYYYSFSSPTWVRWWEDASEELCDENAFVVVGTNCGPNPQKNFLIAQHSDFTQYNHMRLGAEGTGGVRFSSPAYVEGEDQVYIHIGTDDSDTVNAQIHLVSIDIGGPNLNVASLNLRNDPIWVTSPALSKDGDYVFITATDLAVNQKTDVYMITHPPSHLGAFRIEDEFNGIATEKNFGKPASVIATDYHIYVPIGEKLYYTTYTNVAPFLGNLMVYGTPVFNKVCWSATIGVLSFDSSIYSYCTSSDGEIRRWQS